jgi:hypothetical protein
MLNLIKNKRAQNTMEYALLIAIVIGAFSAMQLYVRRGLQARVKAGTDSIPGIVLGQATEVSSSGVWGTKDQYEPYYTREGQYDFKTVSNEGTEKGTISETGGIRDLSNATTTRSGSQTVTGAKDDK